jgi:hypothetical protein
VDLDGDGQGTRQEILIRDSQVPVNFRDGGKVDAGLWVCPYTGRVARSAVWEKYGIATDDDERKSAALIADKCPLHEKRIKLNRVRRWLGTWFDGLI